MSFIVAYGEDDRDARVEGITRVWIGRRPGEGGEVDFSSWRARQVEKEDRHEALGVAVVVVVAHGEDDRDARVEQITRVWIGRRPGEVGEVDLFLLGGPPAGRK